MPATRTSARSWALLLALPAVAFVLVPLAGVAARAPWSHAGSKLAAAGTWTAIRVSLEVTLGATLLSLVLGFPAAWVLARVRVPARRLVRAVIVWPVVLPPVVAGVALLAVLGRFGFLGRLLAHAGVSLPFTTAGAAVAAAFVAAPFLVLALEAGLRSLDVRLEDAARTLGASRWYAFRRVTLPLLRPHLVAGLGLAWGRALGEFGATITFAGNFRGTTQTLPLAVFQALQTDPSAAIMVSVVMLGLSLAVLAAFGGRLLGR
jgi:molybdate transport system permease protein